MKHAKKLLACLLAGALALAVLAGCSTLLGGTVLASTPQAKALMQEIDPALTYSDDLEEAARRLADWMVEDATMLGTQSGLLVRRVALTADSGNMTDTNVNDFISDSSAWVIIPQNVTVGLEMDNQSRAFTGYLYAPTRSAGAKALASFAAGNSQMGAVFIEYGGETYVVALFL